MNRWAGWQQGRRVLAAFAGAMVLATVAGASGGVDGKEAPDFSLQNSAGEQVSLSDLRGDEMHSRYNRVGFSLLGVNIDDDPRRAEEMIESLGVTFPVVFDSTKKVSEQYEVNAMPVTILLDREGVVRYVHHGYKPGYEDKYLEQIRELLRE